MTTDKRIESRRYDARARALLDLGHDACPKTGAEGVLPIYRAPYVCYERHVDTVVDAHGSVLELASGTGAHTAVLARTGARVVATDISVDSLRVLARTIRGRVETVAADMEHLPFGDESFDVVVSAGSLSYGNPRLVDEELRRVLKPSGSFLCVDSLNHNPIYRLNRWIAYKRGRRTAATLTYMPTARRLAELSSGFERASIFFFGSVSFLMPLVAGVVGQDRAARISDVVDRLIGVRRSAFKFVLVAQGRR